jgi:hypothetical protein
MEGGTSADENYDLGGGERMMKCRTGGIENCW